MNQPAPPTEDDRVKEIRAMIASLPAEHQHAVNAIADGMRNALHVGGGHAELALALVGAELGASNEH
jgi:hypothetical protein